MAHAVFIPFKISQSTEHIQAIYGGFTQETADIMCGGNMGPRLINKPNLYSVRKMKAFEEGWTKIEPDRIVCCDSANLTAVLQTLTDGDTLYIKAHSEAGSQFLWSSDDHDAVDVSTVVGYLSPLRRTFGGKVKVFACESGKGRGFFLCRQRSFAARLAREMVGAGWTNCSYFGYRTTLATYVKDGHKRVGEDKSRRASEVRVQFIPPGAKK